MNSKIKDLYRRENLNDITDIVRLQRIERFHRVMVEDLQRARANADPNIHPAELLEEFDLTIAEVAEEIIFHTQQLERVSGRIAEVVIWEQDKGNG